MVAVTYGTAPATARETAAKAPRKAWYLRWLDAIIESRMQQARREIAQHMRYLPHTVDADGNLVLTPRTEDRPAGGW